MWVALLPAEQFRVSKKSSFDSLRSLRISAAGSDARVTPQLQLRSTLRVFTPLRMAKKKLRVEAGPSAACGTGAEAHSICSFLDAGLKGSASTEKQNTRSSWARTEHPRPCIHLQLKTPPKLRLSTRTGGALNTTSCGLAAQLAAQGAKQCHRASSQQQHAARLRNDIDLERRYVADGV